MERVKNTTQNCSAGATVEEVCLLLEFDDALRSKQRENNQFCTDAWCLQLHHPRARREEFSRAPKPVPNSKFWLPGFLSYPIIILAALWLLLRMRAPSLEQTNPGMTGLGLLFAEGEPQQPRGVIPALLEGSGPRMSLPTPQRAPTRIPPRGQPEHHRDRK